VNAPSVGERLAMVRARIEAIERPWTHAVDIVAVTKGFGPEVIEVAVEAGCRSVGENYAQELAGKQEVIERLGPHVHFIGHLQSNKVRLIAPLVDVWETIDRASIATEIARRSPGARVLIQVNVTAEESKSGCRPEDVASLVDDAREAGLDVAGLMTIGPTDGDSDRTTRAFVQTRTLVDEIGLDVCSMGMSADYELAVSCGSTEVRLGSILFGPRPSALTRPFDPTV
jgi:PLP dependent protein